MKISQIEEIRAEDEVKRLFQKTKVGERI